MTQSNVDLGLMYAKEAAKLLGVTEGTLRNWRSAGRGPHYITGLRAIAYRMQDLRAYIDHNTVDPAAKNNAPTLANPGRRKAG